MCSVSWACTQRPQRSPTPWTLGISRSGFRTHRITLNDPIWTQPPPHHFHSQPSLAMSCPVCQPPAHPILATALVVDAGNGQLVSPPKAAVPFEARRFLATCFSPNSGSCCDRLHRGESDQPDVCLELCRCTACAASPKMHRK